MSTRTTPKKQRIASSKPSLSELAAHLSLSKGTVSLILNNQGGRFSEDTRNRVLAAAKEIGYSPDPLARALATGQTGLWTRDNSAFNGTFTAVQNTLKFSQNKYQ